MKIFIRKCMLDQVMHEKNLDREEETEKNGLNFFLKWHSYFHAQLYLFEIFMQNKTKIWS